MADAKPTYQDNPEAFKKSFEELMKLAKDPKKIQDFAKAFISAGEEMQQFIADALNGTHPENKFLIDDEEKKKKDDQEKKEKEEQRYNDSREDDKAKREMEERIKMAEIEAKKYIADKQFSSDAQREQAYQDAYLRALATQTSTSMDKAAELGSKNKNNSDSTPKDNSASEENTEETSNSNDGEQSSSALSKEEQDELENLQKKGADEDLNDDDKKRLKELMDKSKKNVSEEFFFFKSNSLYD